MKKHKWHKEIKAWADGAEIEERWISKNTEEDEWREAQTNPAWDCDGLEFRIKPQVMFNGLTEEETNNTASVKGLTQPKEPQYLYVYQSYEETTFGNIKIISQKRTPINATCIGKIKLEVEE